MTPTDPERAAVNQYATAARITTRVDFEFGYVDFDPRDDVRIGNRMVPRHMTAVLYGAPDMPTTTMTLDVRDGETVCTEITVSAKPDGRPVRASDFRVIHIDEWIDAIIAEVAPVVEVENEHGRALVVGPAPGDDQARELARAAVRAQRKGTRKNITDAHLAQVADVYTGAERAPLKSVERHFGVSRATAARWVSLAKARDFIPGATTGNSERN